MRTSRYIDWLMVFALLGAAVSVYAFMLKTGASSGSVCNINDTFNCDIVNQSSYSELFGIPVSIIGIIGYLFLFVAAAMKRHNPTDKSLALFLLVSSLGATGFALYLSGIEAFVLHAWCLVCLASQVIILVILALSILQYRAQKHL
jgi:uncharacterized membrane protein